VHESQSRLWENLVGDRGRSGIFFYPRCRSSFRRSSVDVSLDQFYRGINKVSRR
jgi:carboxypeptidase Taq